MRNPITGLKQKLLDWEVVTEDEIKSIDKDAQNLELEYRGTSGHFLRVVYG